MTAMPTRPTVGLDALAERVLAVAPALSADITESHDGTRWLAVESADDAEHDRPPWCLSTGEHDRRVHIGAVWSDPAIYATTAMVAALRVLMETD